MPHCSRSLAALALQQGTSRGMHRAHASAGRYLLPIDTNGRFCPNQIDSAGWRRLIHVLSLGINGQRQNRNSVRWRMGNLMQASGLDV
jgi:hypothetical protein